VDPALKHKLSKRKPKPKKVYTLETRLEVLGRVITDIIENTDPQERLDAAQAVISAGLDAMGEILSMDMSDSVILNPDDPAHALCRAVTLHAEKHQLPFEDVCQGLIDSLRPPAAQLN
jgi:hypothetical protein